jgi:hypothetical protein
MSLAVILIAAVPAAAVAAVAYYSKRRSITLLSAAAASALGLATGNPAYAALDVGAVILSTILVWPELKAAAELRRQIRLATKQTKELGKTSKSAKSDTVVKLSLVIFALGLVSLFIAAVYVAEHLAKPVHASL